MKRISERHRVDFEVAAYQLSCVCLMLLYVIVMLVAVLLCFVVTEGVVLMSAALRCKTTLPLRRSRRLI